MARKPFDPALAVGGQGPTVPRASSKTVWTVSHLTGLIRDALEAALPTTIHVVGELSNSKLHTNGHFYFSLKDERSEISCVMWRSNAQRLKFDPTDGMDVVVSGAVNVYERAGRYQLYARTMEPRGVGALELAFRQLCEKLRNEGLFDDRHKRPLPRYPRRVAVVTSETGAAVHDILDTLKRRFPCAEIVFQPVLVQGDAAPDDLARAIERIHRQAEQLGGIDVMIVGRGGGSIEDLWAFNDERVARAIHAATIPIISAVGHESDVTIADLVADVRAATPTAAAELATPDIRELRDELEQRGAALSRCLRHRLQLCSARATAIVLRRAFADPRHAVEVRCRRMDAAVDRMRSGLVDRVHRLQRRLGDLALTLQRSAPQRVVADRSASLARIDHRLSFVMAKRLAAADGRLAARAARIEGATPRRLVESRTQQLSAIQRRFKFGLLQRLQRAQSALQGSEARLRALGYRSILARGYSITKSRKTGELIRSMTQVREGDKLVTEVSDGSFESRVTDQRQGDLFD